MSRTYFVCDCICESDAKQYCDTCFESYSEHFNEAIEIYDDINWEDDEHRQVLAQTNYEMCECCEQDCDKLFENNGEMLCIVCKPVCECCDESYGTVLNINGLSCCEKCNNFECGVCFKEQEYDVGWCPKLGKCVCPECYLN
jgi:hypothetical protein